MQWIAIILFGWPAAIAGTVLIAAGIWRQKARMALVGAFLAAGFCLYVAINPAPFRQVGLVALVSNFLSAYAVRRRTTETAVVFALPFLALELYLAWAVLTE